MEAKWKQVQSEQTRVQKILETSVEKMNSMMTDKVNLLYNRSYKAFINKDKKRKDKELQLTDNKLSMIKRVMDEELSPKTSDKEEEQDKKRKAVTDGDDKDSFDVWENEIKEISEISMYLSMR